MVQNPFESILCKSSERPPWRNARGCVGSAKLNSAPASIDVDAESAMRGRVAGKSSVVAFGKR
jgi:hypothetical protein